MVVVEFDVICKGCKGFSWFCLFVKRFQRCWLTFLTYAKGCKDFGWFCLFMERFQRFYVILLTSAKGLRILVEFVILCAGFTDL